MLRESDAFTSDELPQPRSGEAAARPTPGNRRPRCTMSGAQAEALRILSLSCVYPNPSAPGFGTFIRSRLRPLSAMADVKVLAPIPRIDYGKPASQGFRRTQIPCQDWDGRIQVFYPTWVYPPGGSFINAFLLFLRLLPLARALRKQFAFNIVDAHFGYPDGMAAALLARAFGVPFAITLRGNETVHSQSYLIRILMRWALRRANRVICVSDRLREFALSLGVEEDKAKTIPNGIDNDVFYPHDRADCRAKYGLAPEARIILSAGALIELKGHHRVVLAVNELARRGLSSQLLIAGGSGRRGHFDDDIRRLVSRLGMEQSVRFFGQLPQPELAELMSAADVFCLASSREGWPNVVHEAMACGLPVVATDVGAVPDLVRSPECGLIVPVNDQASLRQALRQVLGKKWDRGAISAWARSRSWEKVAGEVLAEMQQVFLNAGP